MVQTIDFERAVRDFLAREGFAPPRQDETRVVLFDRRVWLAHALAAATLLDTTETQRAGRFRFAHDRTAYVLAHALWRIALGVCLDTTAAQVSLVSSPSGQPRLPGTGLATSLSHSGHWVTLAITGAVTVGVDIEQLPSRFALDDLIPVFCTPAEAAALAALQPSRRELHALAFWTRKEALLKAWGTGLALEPNRFAALTDQSIAPPSWAPINCVAEVRDLDFGNALVGALALPGSAASHRHFVTKHVTAG